MIEKELAVRDIQEIELKMMKFFHDLCEEYQLHYSLGFGSCLGAIRHNGFIPWDDDIDVIMPFSDYKRLIEISKEFKERYYLYCAENDNECSITFAKLIDNYTELIETETDSKSIGVYLDIFRIGDVYLAHVCRALFQAGQHA